MLPVLLLSVMNHSREGAWRDSKTPEMGTKSCLSFDPTPHLSHPKTQLLTKLQMKSAALNSTSRPPPSHPGGPPLAPTFRGNEEQRRAPRYCRWVLRSCAATVNLTHGSEAAMIAACVSGSSAARRPPSAFTFTTHAPSLPAISATKACLAIFSNGAPMISKVLKHSIKGIN